MVRLHGFSIPSVVPGEFVVIKVIDYKGISQGEVDYTDERTWS